MSRNSVGPIALGATVTLGAVQLLTSMNPIGRCMTLLKQLNRHVSCFLTEKGDICDTD